MKRSIAVQSLLGILLVAGALASPAVAADGPAARLLVPVVANTQGALGTFFRTDLTLTNHRNIDQPVALRFYASGEFYYGDPKFETELLLPARATVTYSDVVATAFSSSGNDALGTIVIEGIRSSNDPRSLPSFDPDARMNATYRIWTVQPGRTGTVSQSSAALDMQSLPSGTTSRIAIGVRQDAHFRCNVGIFTNTFYPRNFLVTASSPSGSVSRTVQASGFSLTQVPLPPADLGYMTVTFEPLDALDEDLWTAYASSVDNRSGDSWLQNAAPLNDLHGGRAELTLPVITDWDGGSSTSFEVDLTIRNMRDTPQFVQIYSVVGGWKYGVITLLPFETRTLENFENVGHLSGAGAGWIYIVGASDGANVYDDPDPKARLAATGRIRMGERDGDQTTSHISTPDNPLDSRLLRGTISGLRQDAAFQTVATIWNRSPAYPRTFRITLVGSNEMRVALPDVVVQHAGIEQVPLPAGDFGALSLTVEALGPVPPSNASWTAYGTTRDRVSGDLWLQPIVPDEGS